MTAPWQTFSAAVTEQACHVLLCSCPAPELELTLLSSATSQPTYICGPSLLSSPHIGSIMLDTVEV
jgi:hypothetical protein